VPVIGRQCVGCIIRVGHLHGRTASDLDRARRELESAMVIDGAVDETVAFGIFAVLAPPP
jgi:hypothetical protein